MGAYQEKGYPVLEVPVNVTANQGQSVTVTYPEVGEHLLTPQNGTTVYRFDAETDPGPNARPFCCPVCRGSMVVPASLYQWPQSDTATDLSPVPCKSCHGTGVCWR